MAGIQVYALHLNNKKRATVHKQSGQIVLGVYISIVYSVMPYYRYIRFLPCFVLIASSVHHLLRPLASPVSGRLFSWKTALSSRFSVSRAGGRKRHFALDERRIMIQTTQYIFVISTASIEIRTPKGGIS